MTDLRMRTCICGFQHAQDMDGHGITDSKCHDYYTVETGDVCHECGREVVA